MTTIILILTIILLLAGITGIFMPRWYLTIASFAAMWLSCFRPLSSSDFKAFLFWLIASLLVCGTLILLPRRVVESRMGCAYIGIAAIAGSMVAMALSPTALVIGACIGTFFGALAFSSTNQGKHLRFPSAIFFRYVGAKGLPAIVNASMCGMAVLSLLYNFNLIP